MANDPIESVEPKRPPHCRSLSTPVHNGLTALLVTFIVTGVLFMLLPGTFLGVMNLLTISSRHTPGSADAGWIQAHGHAQIFGWLGSFIFGIALYVVPKMRMSRFSFPLAWSCWGAWTGGTFLRWYSQMNEAEWQLLMPLGSALELVAFICFALVIFRRSTVTKPQPWFAGVCVSSLFLGFTLAFSLTQSLTLAEPVVGHAANQHLLALSVWGFLVPIVFGFSARWLTPFLGLHPLRVPLFFVALGTVATGVVASLAGAGVLAAGILMSGTVIAAVALRVLEPVRQKPRTRGIHPTFGLFVRTAYVWLLISAALNVWSAIAGNPHGIIGASRHAITVGFFSVMVLSIAPRVLPAFAGLRRLFSPNLMFLSLLVVNIGCTLRVVSQVLAYQGYADFAWQMLPISAITEMTALTLFAINMIATFASRPSVTAVEAAA